MIIDCISDLHGSFPELEGGDLLIIAGDLTSNDTPLAWDDFFQWLKRVTCIYRRIVVIGGNHDKRVMERKVRLSEIYLNMWYLCDSGIEIEYEEPSHREWGSNEGPLGNIHYEKKSLKLWGCPWTPWFEGVNPLCDAFMLSEKQLKAKFAHIPATTDILITHGPPLGIRDHTKRRQRVGSRALFEAVVRVRPKLHVFGHIHEGYGKELSELARPDTNDERTMFVNCAHMDGDYEPVNPPTRVIL